MKRIRGHVRAHVPGADPMEADELNCVAKPAPTRVATATYRRQSTVSRLGGRYEWLVRFSKERALMHVLIGVHRRKSMLKPWR